MTKNVKYTGLALLAGMSVALAQSVTFTAVVKSSKVAVGEQFQLSFTLMGPQASTPENFHPPDLSAFVVLSGPMESSQYSWINGRASSSLSYVYKVTPKKEGTITVGAATAVLDGKAYKTDPLRIDVVPAGQGSRGQQSDQSAALQEIGDNLYLEATADKERVRQGEQFILTYKLYTRISVENFFIAKSPTFEGFWAEDFEQPKSPDISTQMINGKQYRVATIKRTALFATQSGTLKITPLEVRCAVQLQVKRPSNDPFDLFNDPIFPNRFRTQEVDIASNGVSIRVDPLSGTPPAGFNGAVGSFSFHASIDRSEVKTGDPVTLTLTVSGTGNVKLVSIPRPVFPADIETYDPKVSEEISRDGNKIRGKKEAEYLLIPRNAGKRVLEPVTFVYYDLDRRAYSSLTSPRFTLNVKQGKEMAGGTFASKEDVRLLGEDIRFLKLTPGSLRRSEQLTVINGWIVAGFLIPPLFFFGAYAYRRRQDRLLGNLSLVKSQKAGKEANRRLKTAEKLLGRGNTGRYHAEISKALFGYLGDKLRIPPAGLTLDRALGQLKMKGLPDEVLLEFQKCIERAEYARFAPGSDNREARIELLDQAKNVIRGVEKLVNR